MKSVFGGNKKALDLAWYILFIPATGLAIPLNVVAVVGMMPVSYTHLHELDSVHFRHLPVGDQYVIWIICLLVGPNIF